MLYEKARVSFEEGRTREAKIHVKNALMQDPGLLAARILLGRIYTREGDGNAAGKELTTAARLGASPDSLVLPRAEAMLVERRHKELIDKMHPSFASAKLNGELLLLRGKAFIELDALTEAEAAYDQAARYLPDSAEPLVGKGQVYLRQGKIAEAETEAIVALKLSPDSVAAWNLKGSIAHLRGNLEVALNDYARALRIDHNRVDVQIAYIGVLIDLKRYSEADAAAGRALEYVPYDPRITYLMAVARTGQGDTQGATAAIRQTGDLLSRLPPEVMNNHGPSLMLGGLVSYSLGQPEQAQNHLERYLQLKPDQVGPRKLLAAILLAQGEAEKALDTLEVVADLGAQDARYLSLLGEAYSKTGRYQQATEALDRALRLNPASTRARTWRGLNNIALGSGAMAAEDLDKAFRDQPSDSRLGVTLLLLRMQQGRHDDAIAVAEKLLVASPRNPTYRNLLAAAQYAAGDPAAARESYQRILMYTPDFLPAHINLAKLDRLAGQPDKAETRLQRLLKQAPENTAVMLELARALHAQGRVQDAILWLEKARARQPRDLATLSLLVELLVAHQEIDRAAEVAEQAQGVAPDDLRVLEALGVTELLRGDKEGASEHFRRMAVIAEQDSARLLDIADLQRRADDHKGAIWTLQAAVAAAPGALQPRILLAQRLAESGQLDKAREAAQAIQADFPEKVIGLRMLADIAMAQGNYQDAMALYRKALAIGQHPGLINGMAHAYRLTGQGDKAITLLSDWLEDHPEDQNVRQALAENYLQAGEWQLAGRQYEQLVQSSPVLSAAWNNLAVIHDHLGKTDALQHARKAYSLDPESATINDTLGWLMVKQGEVEAGLKYLRNAQARAPGNLENRFHIAVALHRIGFSKQAKRELEGLLAQSDDAYWATEARQLLHEISP